MPSGDNGGDRRTFSLAQTLRRLMIVNDVKDFKQRLCAKQLSHISGFSDHLCYEFQRRARAHHTTKASLTREQYIEWIILELERRASWTLIKKRGRQLT